MRAHTGRRPAGSLAWSRLVLLATLLLITAGAWGFTFYQAQSMDMPMSIVARGAVGTDMGGMAASGMAATTWSASDAVTFLAIWSVMMAAMMLPAAAPMVLLFHSIQAQRRGRQSFVPTWIFLAGYLLVWTAVGLAAYTLVRFGSDLATRLGSADRETWAPIALGVTLVAAGLYQLTPLKRVCLNHCRSPLAFVVAHWRDGRLGALRMGLRHGAYCLGCCWALFAVLVAAGIMSVAWMVLLTLLIFVEKVFPQGRRVATGVSAALVFLGLIVAADVTPMPWTA